MSDQHRDSLLPPPEPPEPSDPAFRRKAGISEAPPGAWAPARQAAMALVRPLEQFLRVQASSGILLLIMAISAMLWANSPWQESYHHLWHTPITLGLGDFVFRQDLHFWINDGLMVIFFFVVGLEIRREMHHGELSDLRRAALPIAAAVGGMLAPAFIYLALNRSPEVHEGWGVPMATDIAFAVGVLALLGKRVPSALRVLLLALAIIDDIGAILVIAVFYSGGVQVSGLVVAALGMALVFLLQRIGVRRPMAYVVPGIVIWAGMLRAGVHPTIAGVVLGLLTPVQSWYGSRGFLAAAGNAIREFESHADTDDAHHLVHPLQKLTAASKEAIPPVVRLEALLHPWVAYGIMPLFAVSNAGVTLGDVDFSGGGVTVFLGVFLGLVIGKPLGIVTASLLSTKLGIGSLPRGVDWRGLVVVGSVGGIGFTMALFIAQLAFTSPVLLGVSKVAVLVGSCTAGLLGAVAGMVLLPGSQSPETAHVTVDQAERSTEL
jgi:NhaA family Na+:H+ antiporter